MSRLVKATFVVLCLGTAGLLVLEAWRVLQFAQNMSHAAFVFFFVAVATLVLYAMLGGFTVVFQARRWASYVMFGGAVFALFAGPFWYYVLHFSHRFSPAIQNESPTSLLPPSTLLSVFPLILVAAVAYAVEAVFCRPLPVSPSKSPVELPSTLSEVQLRHSRYVLVVTLVLLAGAVTTLVFLDSRFLFGRGHEKFNIEDLKVSVVIVALMNSGCAALGLAAALLRRKIFAAWTVLVGASGIAALVLWGLAVLTGEELKSFVLYMSVFQWYIGLAAVLLGLLVQWLVHWFLVTRTSCSGHETKQIENKRGQTQ